MSLRDELAELHHPVPLLAPADDCPDDEHEHVDTDDGELGCVTCTPPTSRCCAECRDEEGWGIGWPCATARILATSNEGTLLEAPVSAPEPVGVELAEAELADRLAEGWWVAETGESELWADLEPNEREAVADNCYAQTHAETIIAAQQAPTVLDRETVARRLFEWDTEDHPKPEPTWEDLTEPQREVWRSGADAVLDDAAWATATADHNIARIEDLRSALAMVKDRLDEFTYDELASIVEDDPLDQWGEAYRSRLAVAMEQGPTVLDREAVAATIWRATRSPGGPVGFGSLSVASRDYWRGIADAVLALPGVTQAPTVALDVETVETVVAAHSWDYDSGTCMCGSQDGGADHVARAIVAADPRRTEAAVKAEALREYADTLGVNVSDEDDEWWSGYRQAQREALHNATAYADRIGGK